MSYLLDTNIVSLIIKRNLEIYQKIEDVKAQRKSIFISCITYFEIKRGLLAVAAPKQRERFNQLSQDYSGKRLSEIQTKLCLAWFIARDTVPHTTAHRYIAFCLLSFAYPKQKLILFNVLVYMIAECR